MKSQDKDALEFLTLAFCLVGSLAALSSGEFWAAKKVNGKSDVEIGYGKGGIRFQLRRIQLWRAVTHKEDPGPSLRSRMLNTDPPR